MTVAGSIPEPGTITREGALITIVGHVGIPNRAELKRLILDALEEKLVPIVDVGRAGYIDASAIGALISCAKHMHAFRLGTLVILNPNTELRSFLALPDLRRHLELREEPNV